MGGSLRLARVAGIDIRVHVSFLLVVALGAWQWGRTGWPGMLFGVLTTLSVFTCVVLHELGHSLLALAFGVPVRDITLWPIGGVAVLGRRPDTPLQELLVAVAGPAVNFGLAAALWWLSPELPRDWFKLTEAPAPSLATWWGLLYNANLVLAAFNLLPAFPMDGGRVLRAVLSWPLSLERATVWAVRVGRVLAVGLFAVGAWQGSPTLPVLALFVYLGAGQELADVRLSGVLAGVRLGEAVDPSSPRFLPTVTVGEAVQTLIFWPGPVLAVEALGRLRGVVTREALIRAARMQALDRPVTEVMEPGVTVVLPADASVEAARQEMIQSGQPWVAVEAQGTFLGLVTEGDLARQAAVVMGWRGKR